MEIAWSGPDSLAYHQHRDWAFCGHRAGPNPCPQKAQQRTRWPPHSGRLLRRGLPVTPAAADPVLLNLRGIVARAVDPADDASRTAALDHTLRGLLARFPDTRYAPAARTLFGLAPAEPGQNLTARRNLAAEQARHEVHHFRKRVEPRLVKQIAWELLADADRFTRPPTIAPELAPVTEPQPVQSDPFAWEIAEHEEQQSRLWAAIYAARAELLAIQRQISLRAYRIDIRDTATTAAWRWAAARAEAIDYTTAFAPDLNADELVVLIGWTPTLTEAHTSRLTKAASGGASREQFVHALHSQPGLRHPWIDGFLARTTPSPKHIPETERQVPRPAPTPP
ncbi:hypothetical protein AB0M80_41415 [Amycolatopsis sp. NPDC051045]|uniref:hypothetical protein n=1 Tax=Amycolatopsis sp. NPDC051045 TaxID=3156922 RepID=UPI003449E2A4